MNTKTGSGKITSYISLNHTM